MMKILFVRPPRYMWPFNSESSSFWQPLGFASMAAVLRENDFDVEILDCLPLKIGWKSLRKELERRKPDVLGIGDEVASCNESLKLVKLAKEINPDVTTVAGGYYFSNVVDSIEHYPINFIVRGEGELTMLELAKELAKPNDEQNLQKIDGISFIKNNKIVNNRPRKLIKNLDNLPIPAYDLLPMHLYGKSSKNHKDFAAIEHGRGCVSSCNFCSIWTLMSDNNKPCYRTKSAERSFEETELLVKKYKRKTLNWADGTWNADPEWSRGYCNLVISNNIGVQQTAWMRADFIVRDEKLGVMKRMVDAGLVQAVVGVERLRDCDQLKINKFNNGYNINKKAFEILRKYKKVYAIASLIYGLPDDNKKTLKELRRFIYTDFADFKFLLPYTPYPGTPLWETYKHKIEVQDLRTWNLHMPVMGTKYLTREQLEWWFKMCLFYYFAIPKRLLKKIISERDKRKRGVNISLAKNCISGLYRGVLDVIRGSKSSHFGKKPEWYDL